MKVIIFLDLEVKNKKRRILYDISSFFMFLYITELFFIADRFTTPNRKGEDAVEKWQCYIAGYP